MARAVNQRRDHLWAPLGTLAVIFSDHGFVA